MQVALPRSVDASKLQDQISQRGQQLNDHAVQAEQKQEMKQRSTVMKNDQSDKTALRDGGHTPQEGEQKEKKQENNNQKNFKKDGKHPYKGKFLDFSG